MQLYKDIGYANNRLAGTIVRYNNRPIQVIEIHEGKVLALDILNNTHEEFKYDSKLDINPVPLGYVNNGKQAYYTARCPVRKDWKQGLRGGTFRALSVPSGKVVSDMLNMSDVGKTILGEFPSLKESINKILAGHVSSAFCRDLAVDHAWNVWLKGEYNIGTLDPDTRKIVTKVHWADDFVQEIAA